MANIVKRTTLMVRDAEAAARWYEQVFGMKRWIGLAAGNKGDVGGTYHAMEFGTEMAKMDDLTDPDTTFVKDRVLTWVRVSKWLPWIKMGNRIGAVVFNTAGLRLESFDDLPAVVKANWPAWQSAPPPDDPRPSMTSWDQFKRWRADKE